MTGHLFGQQHGHNQHGLLVLHVSRVSLHCCFQGGGQAVVSVLHRDKDSLLIVFPLKVPGGKYKGASQKEVLIE